MQAATTPLSLSSATGVSGYAAGLTGRSPDPEPSLRLVHEGVPHAGARVLYVNGDRVRAAEGKRDEHARIGGQGKERRDAVSDRDVADHARA